MPFQCDCCQKHFCVRHWAYEAHACAKAAGKDCRIFVCPLCNNGVKVVSGEDANVTFQRHRGSADCAKKVKKKCPTAGCKGNLGPANTFNCPHCKQDVCMKHRFEDSHPCQPPASKVPASAAVAAADNPAARPPAAQEKKKKKSFFSCLCGGKPRVQD